MNCREKKREKSFLGGEIGRTRGRENISKENLSPTRQSHRPGKRKKSCRKKKKALYFSTVTLLLHSFFPRSLNMRENGLIESNIFCCPQVSWIRKSDLHVLTSGELTFTGDARFTPRRAPASDVHTLQIRWDNWAIFVGRERCLVTLLFFAGTPAWGTRENTSARSTWSQRSAGPSSSGSKVRKIKKV